MIRILRKYLAQRRLQRDRDMRSQFIGRHYAKRRAAALRGLGR
jgi:hypothetical protein